MRLIITMFIVGTVAALIAIYIDNNLLLAILVGLLIFVSGLFSKYVSKRN